MTADAVVVALDTHHVLHGPGMASPVSLSTEHLLRCSEVGEHSLRSGGELRSLRGNLHHLSFLPMEKNVRAFEVEVENGAGMLGVR